MKARGIASSSGTNGTFRRRLRQNWLQVCRDYQLYLLLIPVLAYYIIFHYLPMYGIRIAFMEYDIIKGFNRSPWVGFKQFSKLFSSPYFGVILKNTVIISLYSMLAGTPLPILFALLLNSIRDGLFKKSVQTISYAPHFISTVVIVGMIKLFLSPSSGIINALIRMLGGEPINFMGKAGMFAHIYVWSGIWQGLGWSTILYIAALGGVDPELHEAAQLDGASRIQRMMHVDLPCILPTIVIMFILRMGSVLSVGFEKVYLMQNDLNINASETIQTYVYKQGMEQAKYSYSTATGLFNSLVNIALLVTVNGISRKVTETSLW